MYEYSRTPTLRPFLYLPSMLYDFVPFLLSKILCSQYFAEVKQEIWGRKFLPPLLKFFFTQHTIIMHCTVENNLNLKPKISSWYIIIKSACLSRISSGIMPQSHMTRVGGSKLTGAYKVVHQGKGLCILKNTLWLMGDIQ